MDKRPLILPNLPTERLELYAPGALLSQNLAVGFDAPDGLPFRLVFKLTHNRRANLAAHIVSLPADEAYRLRDWLVEHLPAPEDIDGAD